MLGGRFGVETQSGSGYSDPFTLGESRRVNPQAILSAERHLKARIEALKTDSDSDNELVDAFH